jgi:hypothetical protein
LQVALVRRELSAVAGYPFCEDELHDQVALLARVSRTLPSPASANLSFCEPSSARLMILPLIRALCPRSALHCLSHLRYAPPYVRAGPALTIPLADSPRMVLCSPNRDPSKSTMSAWLGPKAYIAALTTGKELPQSPPSYQARALPERRTHLLRQYWRRVQGSSSPGELSRRRGRDAWRGGDTTSCKR